MELRWSEVTSTFQSECNGLEDGNADVLLSPFFIYDKNVDSGKVESNTVFSSLEYLVRRSIGGQVIIGPTERQ